MRIAAVVQRYGAGVVGGAERLCRGVAEGLAGRGHAVEVLTSCASSYRTWANTFPEGAEEVEGVVVRRFRVERERDMAAFNDLSERLFGQAADIDAQREWVTAQGPYAPHLVSHLHETATEFDRILLFTYLYYPTVHGIHVAPERSVLVPTAHDEAPIYLDVFDTVFALPAGLIFNTEAEAAFVRRRFPHLNAATAVVGVGVDRLDALGVDAEGGSHVAAADDPAPEAARAASAAAEPVVLYAGRIEAGKGVDRMIEYLRRFRADTGSRLQVCLIGETGMEIPRDDWIDAPGRVSEAEKVRRFRDATVLIAPSALESFGIVVLEAMAAHTTPLVNAEAEAAVEHCRKSNAGLFYRGYAEFRGSLELLLGDARLRATMARKGASYVRENYSWPEIVKRYEAFLERL